MAADPKLVDFFEKRARAGDGRFAVAVAIMELVAVHDNLATQVGGLTKVLQDLLSGEVVSELK